MATIIYDAEVFPHNWMFGFKIIETNEYIHIWDDHTELREFMKKNQTDFYIGFNSNFYDDAILDTVLKGLNPYATSVAMVERGERIRSQLRFNRMDIAEGMMVGMGLKAIESELGMSIEESDISWDIDRPLTEEEKLETNKYNKHDLDATHNLLNHRWTSFVKTKMDIVKYFNLPARLMRSTMATMIATGLGAKRTHHEPRKFEWFDDLIIENKEVRSFLIDQKFKTENLDFNLCGVDHRMGLGGIHAAREAYQSKSFWVIDVKGYYSLIQINKDLLSRSLPKEGKDKYSKMYYDRLELQAIKDPSALSLKLGILAVWGATLNKWQLLHDMDTGHLIMVTGQAYLVDLLEKLEPYINLIQSNTDGIFIEPLDEDKVTEIVNEWVRRTGFEVTIDKGKNLYQKDVNNYVCLIDGESVAKGGYVASYDTHDNLRAFETNLVKYQSQGVVVDKAIVNYFLYDTPVEETIMSETDPRRFMYTIKKGSRSFSRVEQHIRNPINDEVEITVVNNVNRIFVSNDKEHDTRLYKIKDEKPYIFPRLDTNVFIFNKDLKEFTEDDMNRIDRDYYIAQALTKIEDFITPKASKTRKAKDNKIKVRMWYGEDKDKEMDLDELVDKVLAIEDGGQMRAGDMNVSRTGEFYTFVSKNGTTHIINSGNINTNMFNAQTGKLAYKRIIVERANKYIYIIERDYDTLIRYEDKKNKADDFEIEVSTYEEAFEYLVEVGLVEEEAVEDLKPKDKVVTKKASQSRERIEIDNDNHIIYESFDMGRGVEWEVAWLNKSKFVKQKDADTIDDVLDIIEEWIKDYYKQK